MCVGVDFILQPYITNVWYNVDAIKTFNNNKNGKYISYPVE